mgnify:CR=1 FL=1
MTDAVIDDLARQVIETYVARDLTLGTAESCTGGLIAGALTGISGSSAVVDRGFVTYSNDAKMDLLDVARHGRDIVHERHVFEGDRTAVRMATVKRALELLLSLAD